MLFAAVWSFVVAPALCRAGALAACCTHENAPAMPVACCQSHETLPANPPANSSDPPRECGSCADVCKGVVKPDESRHLPGFDSHAQPWEVAAHFREIAGDTTVSKDFHGLIDTPRLRFPASSLPLRI